MEILKNLVFPVIVVGCISAVIALFSILPPVEKDNVVYKTPQEAIAANFK